MNDAAPQVSGCALLAASLLLGGCEHDGSEYVVLGTIERDRIELSGEVTEPVLAVHVREGDLVEPGQVLLTQSSDRVQAALARAKADEAAAAAALAEAERGPRAQEIAQGRARLEAVQSEAESTRHEYERVVSLAQRNFTSQNEVDILQGRYDAAVSRVDEARAALDELLEGTRNEVIDQARSLYHAAKAIVRDLEISAERANTVSPVHGIVESLPFEVGERPPLGVPLVVILASSPVYARVHIPEPLRVHVRPGQTAVVRIDNYREQLNARVRWVASEAAFTPYFALNQRDRSRLSFLAEIDLTDDDAAALPSGVPAEVVFADLAE